MSKLKDNTIQSKNEIKNGFQALEPGNNSIIETQKLNDFTQSMNAKTKSPFIYNSIKSLTKQKNEENEEHISFDEYMSFIDDQLNDINSKDGLKRIFSVFCDEKSNNISWTKFALVAKELGDNEMAQKLLKLTEQAKLYTKELNFKEFCEIMNKEDEKKIKDDNEEYEEKESYKERKRKNKKKENDEEVGTNSSNKEKNDDNDNDNENEEKSSKRYHRRYRENKTKSDNSDNGNKTNKIHSKYRKNNK